MARRDRVRAAVRRMELVLRLGGKCVDCGSTGSEKYPLEVDHPDGRDYDVRKMDPSWRISVYEKEERAGVKLAVRCRKCNANARKVGGQSVRGLGT